jgi:hypothetical protein
VADASPGGATTSETGDPAETSVRTNSRATVEPGRANSGGHTRPASRLAVDVLEPGGVDATVVEGDDEAVVVDAGHGTVAPVVLVAYGGLVGVAAVDPDGSGRGPSSDEVAHDANAAKMTTDTVRRAAARALGLAEPLGVKSSSSRCTVRSCPDPDPRRSQSIVAFFS